VLDKSAPLALATLLAFFLPVPLSLAKRSTVRPPSVTLMVSSSPGLTSLLGCLLYPTEVRRFSPEFCFLTLQGSTLWVRLGLSFRCSPFSALPFSLARNRPVTENTLFSTLFSFACKVNSAAFFWDACSLEYLSPRASTPPPSLGSSHCTRLRPFPTDRAWFFFFLFFLVVVFFFYFRVWCAF